MYQRVRDRRKLHVEALEPRNLLSVDVIPLPDGQFDPRGITVVPGEVERVVYSVMQDSALVLGRFCSTFCSAPGKFELPPTVVFEYTLSSDAGRIIANDYPFGGGNVFFAETGYARLGAMTPDRAVGEVSTKLKCSSIQGLTYAVGALWFVDQGCNALGRVTLETAGIDEFSFSPKTRGALAITAASSGLLWLTDPASHSLFAIDPNFPEFEVWRVKVGGRDGPEHLVEGPDGSIWFTIPSVNGQDFIGRLTPDGLLDFLPVPEPALLRGVAASQDFIWFTDGLGNRLIQVSADGSFVEPIPIAHVNCRICSPGALAVAEDQTVWFVLPEDNALGRNTLGGAPGGSPTPGGGDGLALLTSPLTLFAATTLPPLGLTTRLKGDEVSVLSFPHEKYRAEGLAATRTACDQSVWDSPEPEADAPDFMADLYGPWASLLLS